MKTVFNKSKIVKKLNLISQKTVKTLSNKKLTLQKLSLFIPFGRFTNAKIRPNAKHAYLTSIFVYICLFLRNFSTWRALILFSDVTAVGAQGCQGSLQLRRRRRQRARKSARALLRTAVASSLRTHKRL